MAIANDFERQMLDLMNEERREAGVAPLQLETRLNASAETHSDWMLDADVFSHTGEGGSSAGDRMGAAGFEFDGSWGWGENVAWQSERGDPGISDDVADLHESLMNSPGHRANILNPDFDYVGIGVAEGDFEGWDAVMVTQNFARTDGTVALDTGNEPAAPVVAETDTQPAPEPQQPEARPWQDLFAQASRDDEVNNEPDEIVFNEAPVAEVEEPAEVVEAQPVDADEPAWGHEADTAFDNPWFVWLDLLGGSNDDVWSAFV